MIKLTTTLALHCDKCGQAYPEVCDKKAGEPDERASVDQALEAIVSIARSCASLRDRAEANDWTFTYSHTHAMGWQHRDLCASCYKHPPEG